MLNVMIFGTGINMQRMINCINYNCAKVIAYIDNSEYKIGKKINQIKIIEPSQINKYSYDFIIIASIDYVRITNQLLGLGIGKDRIIQFYNFPYFLPRTFFFNDEIIKDNIFDKLFTDVYCSRESIICH